MSVLQPCVCQKQAFASPLVTPVVSRKVVRRTVAANAWSDVARAASTTAIASAASLLLIVGGANLTHCYCLIFASYLDHNTVDNLEIRRFSVLCPTGA